MILSPDHVDHYHHPSTGLGWDGVVKIIADHHYGSGTLLHNGQLVLTAAHVLWGKNQQPLNQVNIQFETASGQYRLSSQQLLIHPDYNPNNSSFDLALIVLSQAAPSDADRYALYRGQDEGLQAATLVGYGRQGSGLTGHEAYAESVRTLAHNQLELTGTELTHLIGRALSWQPDDTDSLLIADFDSGQSAQDTLGSIGLRPDLGRGPYEGMIAHGDSGGPAFINQQIAGVASYISRFNAAETDIDFWLNSSFGEVGFWQRVSQVQDWIDRQEQQLYQTQLQHLLDPHTGQVLTEQIPKVVIEDDSGSQQVFFYLQYNGERAQNEIITFNYRTQDGSATAGEDYLARSGQLNLYPEQQGIWIAIEVLGDEEIEGDETFYLSVSLKNDIQLTTTGITVQEQTVMRTILDNESWG